MKHYFTSLLFLLFTLISCKKDKNTPSPVPLMGTWELRGAFTGIGQYVSYPAGNGNTITFTTENKYQTSGDYFAVKSGTFRLTSEIAKDNGKRVNLIRFNDAYLRDVYYIAGDTLTLSTYLYTDDGRTLMDGGGSTYVRVQN